MDQNAFEYGANFDYHTHLQFNSNTVAFFATKFVIKTLCVTEWIFYGAKAGRFNSAFN